MWCLLANGLPYPKPNETSPGLPWALDPALPPSLCALEGPLSKPGAGESSEAGTDRTQEPLGSPGRLCQLCLVLCLLPRALLKGLVVTSAFTKGIGDGAGSLLLSIPK